MIIVKLFKLLNCFSHKKIAILGLGVENHALVRFLIRQKIECEITVCDAKGKKELGERCKGLGGVKWRLGKDYDKGLERYDMIVRSPGYPLFNLNLKKAFKAGIEVTSAIRLFFEFCPTMNIIGVTGTKGKGTTASLIYNILKEGMRRRVRQEGKKARKQQVFLGGNIGVAPFEFSSKIKKNDWVVLELSSFQLEDMRVSPKIAVVTNFFREHLAAADPNNPNYHHSMREYWQAKSNIFSHQKISDEFIIGYKLYVKKKPKTSGKIITFKKSELPSNLIGEHNKENVAAAVEVGKLVGMKMSDIRKSVLGFKGLEHRLELVRSLGGVNYYNDSFATTPDSAITALKSFEAGKIVLIAGGADKGSDFREFGREVKKRCKAVVLLGGKGTDRMKRYIHLPYIHLSSYEFSDFKKAVGKARDIAEKGDVVLLSPGCASFGIFRNYKERGKLFKKYVKSLK